MELEKLIRMGTVKRYNKGELISREGEIGSEMFIILSGQVGVFAKFVAGQPEKLMVLQKGDFLGEVAMMDDIPKNVSGIAESQVIALSITKEDFPFLVKEMPDIALGIIKSLTNKIRLLENRLLNSSDTQEESIALNEAQLAVASVAANAPVLPEGHKTYNIFAPATDENYYYKKEVSCPICEGVFTTKIPRMTKLRLEKRDNDLRERYADFNPLWYTIRTCPHCFFSDHYADFDKYHRLSENALKPYQEKAVELYGQFTLPPEEPLSIDRVLAGYYLALFFKRDEQANPLALAKLYMSLSWLYQDLGDEEWYNRSWLNALEYYKTAYYSSTAKLKPEHEQQLSIILGELHLRKGETKEALKHFYRAIRRVDGSAYYNNFARDRYMEVKESV